VALIQDGILLVVNEPFAQHAGFESPAELASTPLLDLLEGLTKEQTRDFLASASHTDKNTRAVPRTKVTLRRNDGTCLPAEIHAHQVNLNGDKVVKLYLLTADDLTPSRRMLRLPWKLYFCLFGLLLIAALPNLLLPNLNINNAPRTYLPADAPSVLIDQQIRETFPDDEVIVMLFEGLAMFSDDFLVAYHQLSESLSAHPLIDSVIGITRQDHISGSADGFLVEPLVNIDTLADTLPAERRERALSDRFAMNSLIAADGSAIALVVIPQALDDSFRHLALEQEIVALVEENRLDSYLTAMAGEIATDVAQMRAILRDNMIFIPTTVLVGLILIWWLFHRWMAVIITGIVTGAVVSSTIAFYVIFRQPFNSIAGIIPPLLSALTIAALVHFFNALQYASKRGLSGNDRVQSALSQIRRPALFSALTTSAGLASLGLSPIPPISTFGLTAAAGVFLIYLIVIHLLPPIFSRYDNRQWPHHKAGLGLMDVMVKGLFHTGIRYPIWVLGFTLMIMAATIPQIFKVDVETNILEFFPPSHSLRQATEHIEEKLVGTTPLEVFFSSDQPDALITPEALRDIKGFQNWLGRQPEVDKSMSAADFVEEMHWGFHEENDRFRKIPQNADLISQYLFIYDGTDLYDFIDRDFRRARVAINVNVHGANEIGDLMERIGYYLTASPIAGADWELAGAGRMFADQEDLLVKGQIYSLGGALLLILLLMLGLWRSVQDTLICMIPNISPIIVIFIIMGFLGIWLDMATAMIASVAVGIAIDDTIHLYHGFIDRIRQGHSPVYALARTYSLAGRAVMTTTIILCAQFSLLMASAFVPMGHFGILTSIGLLTALLFDLLLLPALLITIYRTRRIISSN